MTEMADLNVNVLIADAAGQVADVALANATTPDAAFDITATALHWILDAPTWWIWNFVLSEFERVPFDATQAVQ